jgi:Family of unknown function (DUF6111)
MIRIILVNLLLLLLPMVVYFSYVYFRRQGEPNDEIVANAPIFWLLAGGAGMMLIVLVVLGQWESGDPSGRYVPPQVKDGIVVPGHIERQ